MADCTNCGAAIPEGHEIALRGRDKKAPILTLCSNCAFDIERAFQAETESPNLVFALLAGLGAALISGLVWYAAVAITNWQLGILAVGVGWLVAQAVMLGAGRKRGSSLQVISVAITLVTMILSEYFIVRHFVVEALTEEGYTDFVLFLPLVDMVELVVEGLKADPLTLVFWAIAAYEAFILPRQRRLRRV
jgi:hypothetical protein